MKSIAEIRQLSPAERDLALSRAKEELRLSNGQKLKNRLALAPLAGTSNLAFRKLALHYGAAFAVSELVSARGLNYPGGFTRARPYLAKAKGEMMAIQLFGYEPEDFRQAIPRLLENPLYAEPISIDLNFGCPVPKVVKTGAGSALLLEPERAGEIVAAAVAAARPYGVLVSAKIRSSWAGESESAMRLLRAIEAAGASLICVHGRSREQFYSGQADWEKIAELAAASRISFYGNGDIATQADLAKAFTLPGLDGVMIGRAAQGAPWIFQQLLGGPEPSLEEKREVIIEHFERLCELSGEMVAVREFRSQLMAYFKGFPGASSLRREAGKLSSRKELTALLAKLTN
ncbi:MAG: tRNA-dihydrouridine synthase [Eubacteriales bacterium]|nr:tRNA-dihydrouridine synthase [Eubacteriales bacterium]